jgi:hypothetical protein
MNEASEPLENQSLEEQLEDLIGDLLSRKKYQAILQTLFASDKGTWVSVKALCSEIANRDGVWPWLDRLDAEELMAMWLDYPNTPASEGSCLLLFVDLGSYWSKAAFFNRTTLPPAG